MRAATVVQVLQDFFKFYCMSLFYLWSLLKRERWLENCTSTKRFRDANINDKIKVEIHRSFQLPRTVLHHVTYTHVTGNKSTGLGLPHAKHENNTVRIYYKIIVENNYVCVKITLRFVQSRFRICLLLSLEKRSYTAIDIRLSLVIIIRKLSVCNCLTYEAK